MPRWGLLVLCSLGLMLSASNALDVYVYGDSLSDQGNTLQLTMGKVPRQDLYFQGRFSNAYAWTDYIQGLSGGTVAVARNFAFGGALACPNNLKGVQGAIPPMTRQVTFFQPDYNEYNPRVHVIWGGHNDLLVVAENGGSAAQLQEAAKRMLGCLQQAATALLDQGETVVVTTLFPVRDPQRNAALDQVNVLVRQLYQGLAQKYGSDKVLMWDVSATMKYIISNFQQFGFKSFKDTCIVYPPGGGAMKASNPQSVCQNPDDFVIYDEVHPTTNVHRLLALNVLDVITNLSYSGSESRPGLMQQPPQQQMQGYY